MPFINRTEKRKESSPFAVSTRGRNPFDSIPEDFEMSIYKSLRESVPVIDASIEKIRRLVGSFNIECEDLSLAERLMQELKTIKVGAMGHGIDEFIGNYLEDLLTYGNAVGEMIVKDGKLAALYNANLNDIAVKEVSPLNAVICVRTGTDFIPCKNQELILASAFNPESGSVKGTSILRGLPFVSETLMKIYRSIGSNWDRLGNVRFAVSCENDGSVYAPERAKEMAEEWQKAMRNDAVSDFVSVGNVSIKAIGSDVKLPDSEVPVRQLLEQIVAKLGVPPFLLGFSWSSTERMSSQQADILTSELEAYRRLLEPQIKKIISLWLRLEGENAKFRIEWDDITMQDETDHALAELNKLKAEELRRKLKREERSKNEANY